MKKNGKYLFCVLLFFITSLVFAQELTISEAVNLALDNNEKIKQYKERLEQKEYDLYTAWGNFLPSISLDGSFTHLNDKLEIDLSPIRSAMIQMQSGTQVELANIYNVLNTGMQLTNVQKGALLNKYLGDLNNLLPEFKQTLKKQDYYQAAFVGIQPLFLGGKLWAAKTFAESEKEAAEIELQKTTNEVTSEVIINCINYLLVKQVVETRKNVLEGMQRHEKEAQKLFEQGLIANYHLLRAKVAVSEAERNLSDDLNNFDMAMLVLKNTIGINDSSKITLTDSLIFNNNNLVIDDLLSTANINQPILKIIEQKKIAATQKFNVERSSFLPQIAAFGKYEIYPQYLSALEPRWAVGIQLKFNLFNGFKDYTKLESAIHLENEVDMIYAGAKRQVNLWVNKAYKDMENYRTKYYKSEASYNLANENLRMNEKRFESGLGTSLEVIDARLSLEKVEIDRLVALNQYYKALTELNLAVGNPVYVLKILENSEKYKNEN
ncbi:MAG TPA: TolC family protein [Melioribacteraceae bacterium]|nr:TolC family protein [Melioribacteraceae bacterium]